MPKNRPQKSENLYRKLAQLMFWTLVTFISLLTYVVEARPFLSSRVGIYCVGVSDGVLGIVVFLAMTFYLASRKHQ